MSQTKQQLWYFEDERAGRKSDVNRRQQAKYYDNLPNGCIHVYVYWAEHFIQSYGG